jgi:hypothetical protein
VGQIANTGPRLWHMLPGAYKACVESGLSVQRPQAMRWSAMRCACRPGAAVRAELHHVTGVVLGSTQLCLLCPLFLHLTVVN